MLKRRQTRENPTTDTERRAQPAATAQHSPLHFLVRISLLILGKYL